jgi:hypothetical protein
MDDFSHLPDLGTRIGGQPGGKFQSTHNLRKPRPKDRCIHWKSLDRCRR